MKRHSRGDITAVSGFTRSALSGTLSQIPKMAQQCRSPIGKVSCRSAGLIRSAPLGSTWTEVPPDPESRPLTRRHCNKLHAGQLSCRPMSNVTISPETCETQNSMLCVIPVDSQRAKNRIAGTTKPTGRKNSGSVLELPCVRTAKNAKTVNLSDTSLQ